MKVIATSFAKEQRHRLNPCPLPGYFSRFFTKTLLLSFLLAANSLFSQNPFITTWKTDNPGSSNSTSITIPTTGTGYNYDADWNNDGTFEQTGITGTVTHDFGTAGTYTVRIRGSFPRIFFNNSGDCSKLLNISQWGNIVWASMGRAFYGCSNLNINATDVPNLSMVTSMFYMFRGCHLLNGPSNIGIWNTATVTDMGYMFESASSFNQPIGTWNTAAVTNMGSMFNAASAFNQPIGTWNTAAVTDMAGMFANATSFNQPIGTWNTAAVNFMSGMFYGTSAFNQPIGNWNTAAVIQMFGMFYETSAFNQPIGNWNTSKVTTMGLMFRKATAFNQPIGTWTLNPMVDLSYMLDSCGMDCTNYSATLIGWSNNPATPNGRNFGAIGRKYETNALAARVNLDIAKYWTITGDALTPAFYADTDGDGFGDAAVSQNVCSQPSGFVANSTDCNDANANVNPTANEICNTVDDDCDGQIDENVQLTFFADADADGFGNLASTTLACSVPSGFVSNSTDCNDANTAIHPGATEICNAIDDDCDMQIDENLCAVPTNLTASDITASTATISWSNCGATSFQLQYRRLGTTTFTTVTVGTSIPTRNLTGLVHNTTYQYRVRAKCGSVYTAYSPLATFSTIAGCSTTFYTSSSATNNSFTVNWFAVPGNTRQQLQYKLASATTFTTVNVPVGDSAFTTPANLLPNTAYQFRLRVKCGTTFLPFLPLTTITTAALKGSENRGILDFGVLEVQLLLSPNPATDVLNVVLTDELDTREGQSYDGAIIVTDVLGRIVLRKNVQLENGELLPIHLETFSSGTYNLQYSGKDGVVLNRRFVVE